MILTIDIGNTKIKFGIFKEFSPFKIFNFDSSLNISDKFKKIKKYKIDTIIISSVVPEITSLYQQYIKNHFNFIPLIIKHTNCNIKLNVEKPQTVGADRICNVAATLKLYNAPAIVIDFGTATTFDIINKNQEFIGGIISPGVETSAHYLMKKADLLSTTSLAFPKNVIGKNTKTNLQSGIMFGAVDQVNGMIERINNETNENNKIILTGGFSKILAPHLNSANILDMHLTLKGMIFIYESNK